MHALSVHATAPEQTRQVARALASSLGVGDVILFKGGLAAGKTLFVSALAQAMGATDPVTSPTFSLVHIYATPMGDLIHVDAYRLETLADFRDLGLDELAEAGVLAIEWGGLVQGDYPDALEIEIAPSQADEAQADDAQADDARTIRLWARSDRWQPVLAILAEAV